MSSTGAAYQIEAGEAIVMSLREGLEDLLLNVLPREDLRLGQHIAVRSVLRCSFGHLERDFDHDRALVDLRLAIQVGTNLDALEGLRLEFEN